MLYSDHMFKVILFDADGMIISSPRFSEQLEKQYGIPWSHMEPFFKGPFQACKIGNADLKEELAKVMQDWGWQGSVDELVDFWFRGATLNQEMIELIHTLRANGVRCSLTTNQERHRGDFLNVELGLKTIFDDIFTSADIGHTKNESIFFEHVYQKLQTIHPSLKKTDVLFSDDHEENILTAKTFGFETHLYQNLPMFKELVTKR